MIELSGREQALIELVRASLPYSPRKVLVVGCGAGAEAAALAIGLGADVTGIDLADAFDDRAASAARLIVADAMHLPFARAQFDFVYSYHALEHIADPKRALAEMRRVLMPQKAYFIGTPNRSRIVGVIGSSRYSMFDRVRWNLADWSARLRGRFRNEYGAHAGYTASELSSLLQSAFGNAPRDSSEAYYRRVYSSKEALVRFAVNSRIASVLFPSVYFFGESAQSA